MKESDLYPPVKKLLESQGYKVKGEVEGCDVVAVRDEEPPVVVELKLHLNLELLLQATDRLALTSKVYLAVPAHNRMVSKQRKRVVKLLRMLGLGLLAVDAEREIVEVILDPGSYRPRKSKARTERLLGEFINRVGDPNRGGADRRRGLMTAYRQRALAIAGHLESEGPSKASLVRDSISEPKAREILYNNVYGWFERVDRGIYDLSPRGRRELPDWRS